MVLMIVLAALGTWLLVSVLLALLIGRAMRLADVDRRRSMAVRPAALAPDRTPSRTPARIAS